MVWTRQKNIFSPSTLKCHNFMNPEVHSSRCLYDLQNTDCLCTLHFIDRSYAYFCRYDILNGISKSDFAKGFMSKNEKFSTVELRVHFLITEMLYLLLSSALNNPSLFYVTLASFY